MFNSSDPRFFDLETCLNLRDLGGYQGLHNRTVRRGSLFRSMTPHYMSANDAAKAAALGIGLVIDLRGDRYTTSGPLGETPARRIAVGPTFLRDLAQLPPEATALMAAPPEDALPRLLEAYGPAFAQAVQTMAEAPMRPTLFHCRLGKDRTGVFAALLLKLLRVSQTDIIEDYMLTARVEDAMKAFLARQEDASESREPRVAREPVSRRAMECVLDLLQSQYGTAHSYFQHYGVPAVALDTLIECLLTPPSGAEDSSQPLAAHVS